MKCMNCGYDNNENAKFCQGCGSDLTSNRSPLSGRMLPLLEDTMFMVLCIVQSVSTLFSLAGGGLPVIGILATVFLWLFFAQGRKGIVHSKHLRCISGTVYASYIIGLVVSCIAAVCGILLVILSFAVDTTGLWDMLYSELGINMNNFGKGLLLTAKFFWVLVFVILVIAAIVNICLTIFGTRSIHRFVQSVYKNLEDGQTEIVKCSAAKTWMMVFGVVNAVLALLSLISGSVSSFLGTGCMAAVYIMGNMLVNKYLDEFK